MNMLFEHYHGTYKNSNELITVNAVLTFKHEFRLLFTVMPIDGAPNPEGSFSSSSVAL